VRLFLKQARSQKIKGIMKTLIIELVCGAVLFAITGCASDQPVSSTTTTTEESTTVSPASTTTTTQSQ
jgi:hypothetical protein